MVATETLVEMDKDCSTSEGAPVVRLSLYDSKQNCRFSPTEGVTTCSIVCLVTESAEPRNCHIACGLVTSIPVGADGTHQPLPRVECAVGESTNAT